MIEEEKKKRRKNPSDTRHSISEDAALTESSLKAWYRKLEQIVDAIERSHDVGETLSAALESLVADFREELGVIAGRLYHKRGSYYVLKHQAGRFRAPIGYKISSRYPPVKELIQAGYILMSDKDPGYDPRVEDVVGAKVFAAILVGEEDEYAISFSLKGEIHETRTAYALKTIRHVLNIKLREQALVDIILKAREIQISLLPRSDPQMEGFDIHGCSIPAEVVGGDLYDYISISDGALGLAIADASGHGLPAALQARDVIIGLRMGMAENFKIVRTIEKLNEVINRSSLASKFVSLFYGELEVHGNFIYTNCGHPHPLLYRNGEFHPLAEGGPVLGPTLGHRYLRGYIQLRPGDTLVLYTDGVSEATNSSGLEFGQARIQKTIHRHAQAPSTEIVSALFEAVRKFSRLETPLDDQTVVVVKPLAG